VRHTSVQLALLTVIASVLSCSQPQSRERSGSGSGKPGDPFKPSQEFNDTYDAEQSAKLKGLDRLKINVFTEVSDALTGELSAASIGSRVRAWFKRYGIATAPEEVKYPSLFLTLTVKCKCPNPVIEVHLAVWDYVSVQRDNQITFPSSVWETNEEAILENGKTNDEVSSALTHALERFSLAYLTANGRAVTK
jgi:hypothetical protein